MKYWAGIAKQLSLLTQLGLSLITPLLLCIGICWWLNNSAGLGSWIYIPGFFLGLGSSFTVAWRFYQAITRVQKKDKKKKRVSFNRHS
ncbi:MAG: AtpZ/AtpI family protein [Eubacteriales bacterium]|nr:AtpZ/AtpI family protein [Eubacteriales bacterium]